TDAVRAAALVHPAIARVSRWFKANGTAYWVVPGIPGENLASVVESKGQLPASDVAGFAMSLLDGLEYLHDQKVYPSFIDPGSIFLVDSGDALFLGSGNSSAGLSGQISQEESTNPGAPSDIYSLAAVFYYCVTGHKPASAQVRRDALEAGGPDPLVSLEPAANSSQAEREITVLIQRGLVLDPSKRPQSVHEWRARISAGMGGRSRPSEPETPREEREWLPRFLLVVFVVAIFAIAWLLFSPRWSDPETGMGKPGEAELTAARETAEEAERWRQALDANAVIGYRTFLDDFPNSIHSEQAEEHIGLLETKAWPAVLEENTRAGFEAHLEIFPDGQYATQALVRIEEFRQEEARLARAEEERQRQDDVAWALARSAGSIAALDGYIAEWPGGSHVAEAHDLRQKMQSGLNDSASFEIATQANTIEAYRRYLQNFPAGRHAAKARESIESLTLSTGKNFRDCTECPLMVVIPAGAFWQGSAEASELAVSLEKPRHRVTIAEPFAVSAFEITMAEWDACAADSGCDTRPQDNGWGRGNRPVIMVSWSDAMQYAAWLSEKTGQVYSLPSESQWEYLARAGEESDWLGGSASAVCDFGNIAGNETSFDWRHTDCEDGTMASTTPAGSHQPNAFGVYDVIGNVAEWTLDCMNLSYLEAPSDGGAWTRGMCSSRMTRGGSWFTGTRESRLAARFNLKNGDRNDFTGFRVVRKVEKQ
ncbi:MAG TPA: SUMF1/EgtB/PvdO family nonheme iron enzyme, partial [Xanthomonadales bacterium]|nr:SUMF1/EgtB/PvdO family nonheme iron enzyme [Xanthomonadales bacterium]